MVLVPVGHLSDNENDAKDWDSVLKRARQAVIDVISERLGIENFADMIESEEVNTPSSWRDKFGLWKGSALG
jgi:phytoene desaturase (3,4-didehydrolycopene-forming)